LFFIFILSLFSNYFLSHFFLSYFLKHFSV